MITRLISVIVLLALFVVLLSGTAGCSKSKGDDQKSMPKSLVGTPPPGAATPPGNK
ncbi:MAG: hypothetical protein ACYDCO_15045 [Armatimonadota bacterium]